MDIASYSQQAHKYSQQDTPAKHLSDNAYRLRTLAEGFLSSINNDEKLPGRRSKTTLCLELSAIMFQVNELALGLGLNLEDVAQMDIDRLKRDYNSKILYGTGGADEKPGGNRHV